MRKDTTHGEEARDRLLQGEIITKRIIKIPVKSKLVPEVKCRLLRVTDGIAEIEVTVNENPAIKRIGEFIR